MNKLIFTQDIPGEREWINRHFSDHINLETTHSGKWESEYCPGSNHIYEISLSDSIWPDIPGKKIKSIFSNNDVNLLMQDKRWTITSDRIINHQFHRNHIINQNNLFFTFTMHRSGTKLIEELLETRFVKLAPHQTVRDFKSNIKIISELSNIPIVILMIYRKNWWDWLTSFFLASKTDIWYNESRVDWSTIGPFEMTLDDLDLLYKQNESAWEFWCNLACALPNHSLFLLEYSDIIEKYSKLVANQKKAPYNKKQLISNYSEMEEIFINQYQQLFDRNQENCCQHLIAMGVETTLESLNF